MTSDNYSNRYVIISSKYSCEFCWLDSIQKPFYVNCLICTIPLNYLGPQPFHLDLQIWINILKNLDSFVLKISSGRLFKHIFIWYKGMFYPQICLCSSSAFWHTRGTDTTGFLWEVVWCDLRVLPHSCSRSQELSVASEKMVCFVIWSLLTPWGSSTLVSKRL